MNLRDTVKALEAKDITVAFDLGAHLQCDLDSNCPIAIQLRRLISETGITFEQLMEGYSQVTNPEPLEYTPLSFDANLRLSFVGKEIDLDMEDVISTAVKDRVDRKLRDLEALNGRVREMGVGLYQSYLREIARLRETHTLPQVTFDIEDVIAAGCYITSENGSYRYIFPITYNPQYIVRSGTRYALSPEDITLLKRDAHLMIIVTDDRHIPDVSVMGERGDKLQHYHGNRNDCWGSVTIPPTWDGRMGSLQRLAHALEMSLLTVNYDSPMLTHPHGMPELANLLARSTELGREGQFDEAAPVEETAPRVGRTPWGARRREATTTGGNPRIPRARLDHDAEMMRRFNSLHPNIDAVCALCGETFGEHFGTDEIVCPADWHRRH